MREPMLDKIPYSQASTTSLQKVLIGHVYKGSEAPAEYDPDIRRRYAAILLRERGL